MTVTHIIMENVRLARSPSPCPMILETNAVPPVPIMKPMPPSTIMKGMTRLIAAKDSFPAKLDTNRPSTTP